MKTIVTKEVCHANTAYRAERATDVVDLLSACGRFRAGQNKGLEQNILQAKPPCISKPLSDTSRTSFMRAPNYVQMQPLTQLLITSFVKYLEPLLLMPVCYITPCLNMNKTFTLEYRPCRTTAFCSLYCQPVHSQT